VSETSFKVLGNLKRYTLATGEYRYDESAAEGAELPGDGSERILITLLALNLILLAFFVVLNAASSFDAERVRAVAASARTSLFFDFDERARAEILSHRGALSGFRDSIADQFASVLPSDQGAANFLGVRVGSDRVEVDVPATVFFRSDGTLYAPLPTLDGLATVMSSPPGGYRAELAIRGSRSSTPSDTAVNRIAVLADSLVSRGVSATVLSAGLLSRAGLSAEAAGDVPTLRFSFFLQNIDDNESHVSDLTIPASFDEGAGQ